MKIVFLNKRKEKKEDIHRFQRILSLLNYNNYKFNIEDLKSHEY